MGMKIDIGNFIAEKNDKGIYIYKAKPSVPFKVKAEYKDKPQYPIVGHIETEFKKAGNKMIVGIGTGVMKYLNTL